ncbi:MAG: S-methyl-5-thioribose-1-phosphate isomerase, partial [Burkholderiales bacterium]
MKVETLRWREGALELIDQRVLPQRFEYIRCTSASETADAIRNMVVRGAPAIGCAAAYGIAVEAQRLRLSLAQFDSEMERAFSLLAASRPTAVNLTWALDRMRGVWQKNLDRPYERLLQEAHAIREEDIRGNREMGKNGAALIEDGATVLT